MATAEFSDPEPSVILTLTKKEAEAIYAITQRTSGHPESSRRGLIDSIASALAGLGLSKYTYDIQHGDEGVVYTIESELYGYRVLSWTDSAGIKRVVAESDRSFDQFYELLPEKAWEVGKFYKNASGMVYFCYDVIDRKPYLLFHMEGSASSTQLYPPIEEGPQRHRFEEVSGW